MPSAERVTLVTGGAGFIGSHLVEWLVRRGDRVVVIDDLSTGRAANLAAVRSDRVEVREATVSRGLRECEAGAFSEIYHLAAAVGVRLVINRPVYTIENNIDETSAVLRYASSSRTPTLIASTSEVYGKSERVPFREDDDVVYGPTIYARWAYACSKAIDEHLAMAYHADGLPTTIVRFFNTIGPRQIGDYGMVVPRFIAAALANEPIQVYGDGRQVRCFCDVRDVVGALPMLLQRQCGAVFNVGTDQPISIAALAELVRDTLSSSSSIELVPYDEAFGPRFDDLQDRVPDLTRIREAISFQPRISLRQSILDMAAVMQSETATRKAAADS